MLEKIIPQYLMATGYRMIGTEPDLRPAFRQKRTLEVKAQREEDWWPKAASAMVQGLLGSSTILGDALNGGRDLVISSLMIVWWCTRYPRDSLPAAGLAFHRRTYGSSF